MEAIMKTTSKTLIAATAIVLGAAFVIPAFAQGPGYGMGWGGRNGDCPWFGKTNSQTMTPGQGRGYGMRGMGMGGWMLRGDLNLTVEKVKDIFEGRIAMHGNDNIKVGEVKALEDGNFTVTIVTQDGSLVQTLTVDKDTGRPVR
jgi:hypothetical protein